MKTIVKTTFLLTAFATGLALQTGCEPASDGTFELLDTKLASLKLDDLGRTMDFVRSEKRFDQDEFNDKVVLGLNRWANSDDQLFKADWKLDPMASSVVAAFADEPTAMAIGNETFSNTDPYFLQQCSWLGRIADRVKKPGNLGAFEFYRLAAGDLEISDEAEDPLAEILGSLNGLEGDEAKQLALGLRGFDWIVRNIQLEEPVGDDVELQGGLGYKRMPWQNLIYSRGDYVERGKLFILLAKEMGLNSVMFATGEDKTPWCVGLVVGDSYFLFDPKLGMPVPGDKPGKIATLSQAANDESILNSLDLTVEESLEDDSDYWVKSSDLESLTALIYTSPEHLSRRMSAVEENLTSDYSMKIAFTPTEVAATLPERSNVNVEPWDIDFKTRKFRRELEGAKKKSSFDNTMADKVKWQFKEEGYIDAFSVYRTARARYFSGRFDIQKRRKNAIESFYFLMYSDERIASLATDTVLQQAIGIRKQQGQSAADYQMHLKSVQEQMKLVRRDAGFFLAQCHFDNGNIGTAANWLDRLLIKADAQRWRTGVEYLLARALETRGEYDRAIEIYGNQGSTQLHGNLIRRRQLKSLVDQLEVSAK